MKYVKHTMRSSLHLPSSCRKDGYVTNETKIKKLEDALCTLHKKSKEVCLTRKV